MSDLIKTGLEHVAQGIGFRYSMPDWARALIDAKLGVESDPTWMMSDDYRACNGITLTEAGLEEAKKLGMVCKCVTCGRLSEVNTYCSMCDYGIHKYGISPIDGCKLHWLSLVEKIVNATLEKESLPILTWKNQNDYILDIEKRIIKHETNS